MIAFLLAVLKSNLAGAGGGGPFTISAVSLSQNQAGTSCSNKFAFNVGLTYGGSTSGVTCKVERDFNGEGWTVVATGLTPESFPYVMSVDGYYNKFGTPADTIARVTSEVDPATTATSATHQTTYTLCGGA